MRNSVCVYVCAYVRGEVHFYKNHTILIAELKLADQICAHWIISIIEKTSKFRRATVAVDAELTVSIPPVTTLVVFYNVMYFFYFDVEN